MFPLHCCSLHVSTSWLSYYWRICLVTEPLASPGQLKWCAAATRTQSLAEQPLAFKAEHAQTLPLWHTHAHTAACPHMVNTVHLSNVRASNQWLTCSGQKDGLSVKGRSGSSLYLWEFISSLNTVVIYNRYGFLASKNINVKRIYNNRNKEAGYN